MKKIYIVLGTIIVSLLTILFIYKKDSKVNYINYNGFKLAMSVNGEKVSSLPSGNYFLVRYECTNGTILSWDNNNNILTSENTNINDTCYLEFESSPQLYDLVNIGDYITYTGDNGCTDNQCIGWNNAQSNTDLYENYGYCNSTRYKFYTYGWRVLYKDDNSVYIISAGAPECIAGVNQNSSATKTNLNNVAQKYCNDAYISGGTCEENTTSVHAFNGEDFNKFTSQYYGNSNARFLNNYNDGGLYDPTGTKICYYKFSQEYCGYNNDVIDNGGYYWFAAGYSSVATLNWYANGRRIGYNSGGSSTTTYGVRPVIKLDSTIKATGGLGTMTEPYTITTRTTQ